MLQIKRIMDLFIHKIYFFSKQKLIKKLGLLRAI